MTPSCQVYDDRQSPNGLRPDFKFERTVSLACLVQQPAAAQELLLTNAHIVDPKARKVRTGALLIRDGVIVGTPSRAPRNFSGQILYLKGKWIIPGLNDLHTHSFGNPPFMADGDTPGTAKKPGGSPKGRSSSFTCRFAMTAARLSRAGTKSQS